jgi:multicomponent Na+:H+ antiporter subunit G
MTYVICLLLLAGTFLFFLTGLGLIRMPDVFCRMHAATKGASLGVALLLIAAALYFRETGVVTKAVVTLLFIFLTAPVAASLLGRAAYARKIPLWDRSVLDEGRNRIDVPVNPVADNGDSSQKGGASVAPHKFRNSDG